jgi:hypothetical protein
VRLLEDRIDDVALDRVKRLGTRPEERIEERGGAELVTELAVLEEDVHRLVEHVAERFNQFLMDVRVARRGGDRVITLTAGHRERHRTSRAHRVQRFEDVRIAFRRTEADQHVARPRDHREPVAVCDADVERGERALPDDHRMDELDRDVHCVGRVRPAAEREETAAVAEALGHRAARVCEARRLAREERERRLRPFADPRGDPRRELRAGDAQHIRGSGSPTSMSTTRVPP